MHPVTATRNRIFYEQMKSSDSIYDILIIGAGPAGLSCAIEAGRRGMRALVVDKGSVVHSIQQFQRDMLFFSTPELLSIGNIPFIVPAVRPTSLDCVNYYRSVVEHFALECRFYEKIESMSHEKEHLVLKSASGARYRGKAVVIATGYYDTPTQLGVPGEGLPHVTHYYRDPLPYYRRDVVIVGGKNSAAEAALDLWRHGARVTVIHRGAAMNPNVKYWLMPDFQNRVADGSITLHLNSTIKEFTAVTTVVGNAAGGVSALRSDAVFILIGYRPDVAFLESFGIAVDAETLAPTHNPETMETNVKNLFVAGGMVGGIFNGKVFIENGREHGKRIIDALAHRS